MVSLYYLDFRAQCMKFQRRNRVSIGKCLSSLNLISLFIEQMTKCQYLALFVLGIQSERASVKYLAQWKMYSVMSPVVFLSELGTVMNEMVGWCCVTSKDLHNSVTRDFLGSRSLESEKDPVMLQQQNDPEINGYHNKSSFLAHRTYV